MMVKNDNLTGVYNKSNFAISVKSYLERNYCNNKSVLFVFDMADFAEINDNLGRSYGDAVFGNGSDENTEDILRGRLYWSCRWRCFCCFNEIG